MTHRLALRCALMGVALAAAGCHSTPVRYYSLVPGATNSSESPNIVCCSVEITQVHVPTEVDRHELVTRGSDERMYVLDNDVWIAPLSDEIRDALLLRIRPELARAPAPDDSATVRKIAVTVDVERFEAVLARHALVAAQWSVGALHTTAPNSAVTCNATIDIPVDGVGVEALVAGQQKAIAALADRIAASVALTSRTGKQASDTVQCPAAVADRS